MTSSSLPTRALRNVCLLLIALALLAAGFALKQRIHAERSARSVDIVVDYAELEALAARQGAPLETVLARMKRAGATAVALPEETLQTLEDAGKIMLTADSSTESSAWSPVEAEFTVIAADPATHATVVQGLAQAYEQQDIIVNGTPSTGPIRVRGTKEIVGQVGLGLSPEKVAAITIAGLRVVPRLVGEAGVSAKGLKASLAAVAGMLPPPAYANLPRGIVIFDGKTIAGYRKLLPVLAKELQRNNLAYGSIEFSKQKGDEALGRSLHGRLVRVHSIPPDELATMSNAEAVQRFALAAKDRNIRVLYVRMISYSSNDPLTDAAQYIYSIKRTVRNIGGMSFIVSDIKPAHAFELIRLPSWTLALLFLGAGASLVLWLMMVLPAAMPRKAVLFGYGLLIGAVAATIATAVVAPWPGRTLFGLAAAVGFPLLSLTWAYRQIDRAAATPPRKALPWAVGALLVATGITLIGGLFIAAMMADSMYLVKVLQFSGVKVALAFPLLIFAGITVADGVARDGESWAEYGARTRQQVRKFLSQPLYVWAAVITTVALAVVGIMLMRSGNDSGVGVSGSELKLRSLLEQWFIARPRTKEFAFGVPLFIFSMIAAANRRRGLAAVLLLGAAIGQVDVLNTYCHAHTPVMLSLLRTFNGLWLGIVIAAVALVLLARPYLRPAKTTAAVTVED